MRNSLMPVSVLAFLIAIIAWAGVWYMFSDVSARLADRSQAESTALQQSAQAGTALELQALVADTASERATLDNSFDTDIVGIANQINSAGQAAGAQTTIGSASLVQSLPSPSGVNEVEFIVQSTGTFAQVWQAAQLFSSLSLPSSVSELDFEQLPNATQNGSWQLTAHIDVLTSAQISS